MISRNGRPTTGGDSHKQGLAGVARGGRIGRRPLDLITVSHPVCHSTVARFLSDVHGSPSVCQMVCPSVLQLEFHFYYGRVSFYYRRDTILCMDTGLEHTWLALSCKWCIR